MQGDIEFTEFELLAFEDLPTFKEYFKEFDKEFDLSDIDELILYYQKKALDLQSFANYLTKFKHEKGI